LVPPPAIVVPICIEVALQFQTKSLLKFERK
jgi:hypothetical protein